MSDNEGKFPILEMVEDNRVFWIERRGDLYCLIEGCDDTFEIELTKAQLRQLGEELISFAES